MSESYGGRKLIAISPIKPLRETLKNKIRAHEFMNSANSLVVLLLFSVPTAIADARTIHRNTNIVNVITPNASAHTLTNCTFTDCTVSGKGGIVGSSEVSGAKTMAETSAQSINVDGCEFTGCSSDETPELSFTCDQLTITESAFQCAGTHDPHLLPYKFTLNTPVSAWAMKGL